METGEIVLVLASGLATGIGGLAVLAVPAPAGRARAALLGFTGGVMLAAAVFSLLVPALDDGSLVEVVVGFAIGAVVIFVLDEVVPHAHARFTEHGQLPVEQRHARERSTLLLSAMTIHNIPEGMAVGIAFAAGGADIGVPLAIAIGIQNIPEGFVAAAPLVEAGTGRRRAAAVAFATGAVEPPAAFAAFAAFAVADVLLAGGLALAAGAMLYVVVDELIPEARAELHERAASVGTLAGFLLMLTLDNVFG